MIQPWIIWLVLTIIFILWEVFTVALVSIWFAVASIISLVLSLMGYSFLVQVIVMIIVSVILLILFMICRKKFFVNDGKYIKTNADRLIGNEAIVKIKIDNLCATGQVLIMGQVWSAASSTGEVIEENKKVIVENIKGVKLYVKEV